MVTLYKGLCKANDAGKAKHVIWERKVGKVVTVGDRGTKEEDKRGALFSKISITIFVVGGMQILPIRSQDTPYYSQWAFVIH